MLVWINLQCYCEFFDSTSVTSMTVPVWILSQFQYEPIDSNHFNSLTVPVWNQWQCECELIYTASVIFIHSVSVNSFTVLLWIHLQC